jgi:hypothetical protein
MYTTKVELYISKPCKGTKGKMSFGYRIEFDSSKKEDIKRQLSEMVDSLCESGSRDWEEE